jgi:hypothetical protein
MLEALLSLGLQTCQVHFKRSLGVSRYKCAKRFNAFHVHGDVADFFNLGIVPAKRMLSLKTNGQAIRSNLHYFLGNKSDCGLSFCCFSVENL